MLKVGVNYCIEYAANVHRNLYIVLTYRYMGYMLFCYMLTNENNSYLAEGPQV